MSTSPFPTVRPASLLWTCVLPLLLSCGAPTRIDSRDLLEMERVWQYLKVFCLWQDRVPSDPLAAQFATPGDLTNAIHDLLKGGQYTVYYPPGTVPDSYFEGRSAAAGASSASQTVFFFGNLSDSTAYVYISEFTSTTFAEFRVVKSRLPNLIVDLRGDGGGAIDACTSSIELLLPGGVPYIEATYRRYDPTTHDTGTVTGQRWYTRYSGDSLEGKKIAVLVDGNTASAAEIFAAGLRDGLDTGKVRLIGQRTFGKGIGQYVRKLASGAWLKITGFSFMRVTPVDSLKIYHLVGIPPDMAAQDGYSCIDSAGKWLEGASFRPDPGVLAQIGAIASTGAPGPGMLKAADFTMLKDSLP